MKRKRDQTQKLTANSSASSQLPTFLEHVYELRRRLFWVVAVILGASAAAYPFLDTVLSVLTAPLGGQQLYYLTPIGGFSFSIKICFYVGILAAVPFGMYHLYRYLEPLMGSQLRRSTFFYAGFSTTLAVAGVAFAYFISLPGALHFLTGMDLKNVQAMLTVDSYLTFVMTYLLGAALLFQIPLLLLIINTMTPLKPGKLMKIQRFVIVGAFIIAAIISPTPDIMNQILLALPIVVMYQIGVLLVWLQNSARAGGQKAQTVALQPLPFPEPVSSVPRMPIPQPISRPAGRLRPVDGFRPAQFVQPKVVAKPVSAATIDGMVARPSASSLRQAAPIRSAQSVSPPRSLRIPARSVDGFGLNRPSQIVSSS